MVEKQIKVAFSAPLNDLDTEFQTYGCRANSSDICANNSIPGICAFASDDCVCHKPSRAWRKQYFKLKEGVLDE